MLSTYLRFLILISAHLQVYSYSTFLRFYNQKSINHDLNTETLLQNSTESLDSSYSSISNTSQTYQTILETDYNQETSIDYSDIDDESNLLYIYDYNLDYDEGDDLDSDYSESYDFDFDNDDSYYQTSIIVSNTSDSSTSETDGLGSDYLNSELEEHETGNELTEDYYNTYSSSTKASNTTIIVETSQYFGSESDIDDFEYELEQLIKENLESDYDDKYEGESYIYVEYDSDEDEYQAKYYNSTQIQIEQTARQQLEDEDENDEEDSVSDSSSAWDV